MWHCVVVFLTISVNKVALLSNDCCLSGMLAFYGEYNLVTVIAKKHNSKLTLNMYITVTKYWRGIMKHITKISTQTNVSSQSRNKGHAKHNKLEYLAKPSLVAARPLVDRNYGPIFRRLWSKVHQIKCECTAEIVGCNGIFDWRYQWHRQNLVRGEAETKRK